MIQTQITGKNLASLYIHIPFCQKKCPYCHFYTAPALTQEFLPFLIALKKEWERYREKLASYTLLSIYFGGGTPFLMPPKYIAELLDEIRETATISSHCEITIEANPTEITQALCEEYAACGINRISIGVQSFHDPTLMHLGRRHDAKKAIEAIESSYAGGLKNISIDLLYETPYQTLSSWQLTLDTLSDLPISHLSLYNLTFEPNTYFYRKKQKWQKTIPEEKLSLILLEKAVEKFFQLGLKRYEISAFAKEGKIALHNIGYWQARPFIGLGPSAFSYWEKRRFKNISSLQKYKTLIEQDKDLIDFSEKLSYPTDLHELFLVALRLIEGVDMKAFEKKHAPLPQKTYEKISFLQKMGLLQQKEKTISLTEKGLLFYDYIAEQII